MKLPDWAKDPDEVLRKRAEAEKRPSLLPGSTTFFAVIVLVIFEVLEAVSWLGGLKAMGW